MLCWNDSDSVASLERNVSRFLVFSEWKNCSETSEGSVSQIFLFITFRKPTFRFAADESEILLREHFTTLQKCFGLSSWTWKMCVRLFFSEWEWTTSHKYIPISYQTLTTLRQPLFLSWDYLIILQCDCIIVVGNHCQYLNDTIFIVITLSWTNILQRFVL